MPDMVETLFTSQITPNVDSVFSSIIFSLAVSNFQAVDPQTVFQNPLKQIYATYSYDNMNDGVQWSALFYRNGKLVYYETAPWEGGTGGYGQLTLELRQDQWQAGTYQLIFFVGMEWKVLEQFLVMGDPPTPTISPTISITPLPSLTPTITNTRRPTFTPRPTDTRWPSPTP